MKLKKEPGDILLYSNSFKSVLPGIFWHHCKGGGLVGAVAMKYSFQCVEEPLVTTVIKMPRLAWPSAGLWLFTPDYQPAMSWRLFAPKPVSFLLLFTNEKSFILNKCLLAFIKDIYLLLLLFSNIDIYKCMLGLRVEIRLTFEIFWSQICNWW